MNMPLKVAIVQSRKSQTEIAKLAGIHESRLSRIVNEHGSEPSDDERKAIAKALKRKVHELFSEVAA